LNSQQSLEKREEERIILGALDMGKSTTRQLISKLPESIGSCPDELMRTLNKMRRKGQLEYAYSEESGDWLWWRAIPSKAETDR